MGSISSDIQDRAAVGESTLLAGSASAAVVEPPLDLARNETRRSGSSRAADMYRCAAEAIVQRWFEAVGPGVWWQDDGLRRTVRSRDASDIAMRDQQAVALMLSALSESDSARCDRTYAREAVRAALLRWQLHLRGDGQPLCSRSRHSQEEAVTTAHVVSLLSENSGFENALLLADLAKHLWWFAKRRALEPRCEAMLIRSLADGAVLLRDSALRSCARRRLGELLARQDDEGWFQGKDGFGLVDLVLQVDPLARILVQQEWSELEQPIRRVLRFLSHFVHPDGVVRGRDSDTCRVTLPPYGLELLAPRFEEAACLAAVARCQWRDSAVRRSTLLGASAGMAASVAGQNLESTVCLPHQTRGATTLGHAGVAVFSTPSYYAVVHPRRGGAVHVTWRNGTPELDDAGVTVVFAHRITTSALPDRRGRGRVREGVVTAHGLLRRIEKQPARFWRRIVKRVGRIAATCAELARNDSWRASRRNGRSRTLTHDRYRRTITFGDTWVSIRDEIECRLRCQSVVCQLPIGVGRGSVCSSGSIRTALRNPIIVDGGRHVRIERRYDEGKLVGNDHGRP